MTGSLLRGALAAYFLSAEISLPAEGTANAKRQQGGQHFAQSHSFSGVRDAASTDASSTGPFLLEKLTEKCIINIKIRRCIMGNIVNFNEVKCAIQTLTPGIKNGKIIFTLV
jgi:hypothetical protein